MIEQGSDYNDPVEAWVEEETRPLDVVASWENLLGAYDALRFEDPITDSQRLEEFQWIIKTMNSFLTKMRGKLRSCNKDLLAMREVLVESFTPVGKVNLESRKSLAYQKLRQLWVSQRIAEVNQAIEETKQTEGEVDGSGEQE